MDIKPQPSRRPQSFFTPRRQTFSPHNPAHQNTTVIRPGANSNNAASDPMPAAATPHAGMAAAPQVGSARQPFTEPELPPVSASSMHAQQPTTVASTLTGLPVDPSVNKRQVTAVMIENSLDARPQSGLDQAGIVFEALAEGGVTRFMALFQDTQPDYIGPVRSARPYYIQWLLGYDAAYAHVGGSPDALNDITAWHVKDLNQFY